MSKFVRVGDEVVNVAHVVRAWPGVCEHRHGGAKAETVVLCLAFPLGENGDGYEWHICESCGAGDTAELRSVLGLPMKGAAA